MSAPWLISIPVWGSAYVRTFVDLAAPALLAAVARLDWAPVKFIIHTDAPDAVRAALPGQAIDVRSVGTKPTYVALQEAHADAVRSAAPGDRVVLLNADLVVSGNFFVRCAEHFAVGKQAVVLLGIRTVIDFMRGKEALPPGAGSRELLNWAWGHRHQIIRDLEWPQGASMLPTNLFFARGDSVVARGFHLHPAAIIKHAGIAFSSTIDGDLLDYFPRETIHVVTDPDDCSMLEMSQASRRFPIRPGVSMAPARVAASMRTRASSMHRWLVTHRIGVVGPVVDCGDALVIERTLALLGAPQPSPTFVRGMTPTSVASSVRAVPRNAPGGLRGRTPRGPS